MVDYLKYETKSVQAIPGTEARAISKWENQGWDLVAQTPSKLRTTLNSRRSQPRKPWLLLGALGAVVAVILAIVGIVAAVQGSDDGRPEPAATATDSSSRTYRARPQIRRSKTSPRHRRTRRPKRQRISP